MKIKKNRRVLHPHIVTLIENVKEVRRLLNIHEQLTGTGRGYRHDVQVLNKSGVVMLVAGFEYFMEDLAVDAFSLILKEAKDHKSVPADVRVLASKPLKDSKDQRDIWKLADKGWKNVLVDHKKKILEEFVQGFNTPHYWEIDSLFKSLTGISSLSRCWSWEGMSTERARKKIRDLVWLRGDIAHRVKIAKTVKKQEVKDAISFIYRVSTASHNAVNKHLGRLFGRKPWSDARFKPKRN